MFNMKLFKKEEKQEENSQKSKLYLIVFGAMLLVALVLSISQKFQKNKPIVENSDNEKVVEQNTSEIKKPEVETIEAISNGDILGNKDDLVSFSILPNTKVFGIQSYRGSVKGGYFFEGNILINILDANKKVLKKGNATAKTDWMTREPIEFEGSIDFTGLTKGPAYIEIHNDNASGLPANDKSILIPIIID